MWKRHVISCDVTGKFNYVMMSKVTRSRVASWICDSWLSICFNHLDCYNYYYKHITGYYPKSNSKLRSPLHFRYSIAIEASLRIPSFYFYFHATFAKKILNVYSIHLDTCFAPLVTIKIYTQPVNKSFHDIMLNTHTTRYYDKPPQYGIVQDSEFPNIEC